SCYFFFSSRRRHTRSKRDWSSDVCSSDLPSPVSPFRQQAMPRMPDPVPTSKKRCPALRRPDAKSSVIASRHSTVVLWCPVPNARSEERRVGKEGRVRWARDHYKRRLTRDG